MSTIKEELETKTHKGNGLSIHERIFYTLTDVKGIEMHRTAKLVSILISRLVKSGKIKESELDNMLLEIL
jgi:hypothetical protein